MPSVREKARQPFPHNLWGSGSFRSPHSLLVFLPFAVKDKCWGGGVKIVAFLLPKMFQKEKQTNPKQCLMPNPLHSLEVLVSLRLRCGQWQGAALWDSLGIISFGVPPCAAHKLLVLKHVLKNSWQTALLWMMANMWYWFLFPIGMSWHFQHGTGNSDRVWLPSFNAVKLDALIKGTISSN